MPCTDSCARNAGQHQILTKGIPPQRWLTMFGRTLNCAANGDPAAPLPLLGPQPFNYRLHARVEAGRGGAFHNPHAWDHIYVRLQVCVRLPFSPCPSIAAWSSPVVTDGNAECHAASDAEGGCAAGGAEQRADGARGHREGTAPCGDSVARRGTHFLAHPARHGRCGAAVRRPRRPRRSGCSNTCRRNTRGCCILAGTVISTLQTVQPGPGRRSLKCRP